MWCRHVRSQLSAYADGELSAAQARMVEEHLVCCERCSQEHADFRQLARLTAIVPLEDVPTGLHARIMTSLAYASTAPVPTAVYRPRRAGFLDAWMLAGLTTATAAVVVAAFHKPAAPFRHAPVPSPVREARTPVESPATTAVKSHERQAPHAAIAEAPRPQPESHATPEAAIEQPAHEPAPQFAVAPPSEASVPPAPVTIAHAPVKPAVPAVRKPQPKAPAERLVRRGEPAPGTRDSRPQPVAAAPGNETPAVEPKTEMPPAPPSQPTMMAVMPGDPVVNSAGSPNPADNGAMPVEKDSNPRMAGMAMEVETPAEEDEGLRALRMFLEERNKTVPQPPAPTGQKRDRQPKKSL